MRSNICHNLRPGENFDMELLLDLVELLIEGQNDY
jgi:hypothetical protein